MIMKCCGQFSGCRQRSCQRNSSDVIVGGLSKLKSKQELKKEFYKIFGNNPIKDILANIFYSNKGKNCKEVIEAMINDNNRLPFDNANRLYVRIVYGCVIEEVRNKLKLDKTIDKTELMTILKNVYPHILSELSEEQKCIIDNMERFKSLFSTIDFNTISRAFRLTSSKDVKIVLDLYCELEIALNDPNIIAEQLNLKWFARNFIKKQSKTSDDDIHNDDDDAFLLYYLNEVNKDK